MAFPLIPAWVGYFAIAFSFAIFICCTRDWYCEKKSSDKEQKIPNHLFNSMIEAQKAHTVEIKKQAAREKLRSIVEGRG